MTIKDGRVAGYRGLRAWQLAVELTQVVYASTEDWPAREVYGLTSQVRRAAVSIPANIAEGKGRLGKKEFRQHLGIAYGSLCELETLIHLAVKLGYSPAQAEAEIVAISDEVARKLRGLINSLSPD